jgi:hypothetical protein
MLSAGRQALEVFVVQHQLPFAERFRMIGNELFAAKDGDPTVFLILYVHDLSDIAVKHGIPIRLIGDHAVRRHLARMALDLLKRREVDGFQSFLQPALHGNRPGGTMNANVGDLIQPLSGLKVEIVQARERANPRPKIFAHVTDSVFDFALRTGPVRPASLESEAMVAGKVRETLVPDGMSLIVGAGYHGFHIVVQDDFRPTAEVLQCPQVASDQRVQLLILRKLHVHHSGVAHHHHERIQPFRTAIPVRDEPSPIHLSLVAGRCFVSHGGFADDRGAQRLHKLPKLRSSTRVAFGSDLLKNDPGVDAALFHSGTNVVLEWIELGGFGYRTAIRFGFGLFQPFSDRFAVSPQFFGNLRDVHASFPHFVDQVKFPISNHDVSLPLRGDFAFRAGNFQPILMRILPPLFTNRCCACKKSFKGAPTTCLSATPPLSFRVTSCWLGSTGKARTHARLAACFICCATKSVRWIGLSLCNNCSI